MGTPGVSGLQELLAVLPESDSYRSPGTGRNRFQDRMEAAKDLVSTLRSNEDARFVIVAHSHGGSDRCS